jgi:hypothetical protein
VTIATRRAGEGPRESTRPCITHDRGLGTAYERWAFYRLLQTWAERLGVKTFLEGPLDGMAGVPGVHGVGLARRGVTVTSAVTSEEQAEVVRGIYETAAPGGTWSVLVAQPSELGALPQADMVMAYHVCEMADDWRAYLATAASRAKKALVVTVCNPENWGVSILRWTSRLRGLSGMEPPEAWRTEVLAPVLWKLGRVREHEYFDCPWWPDLQVSPGQSLLDRAKKLFSTRKDEMTFTASMQDGKLAENFVYGVGRWPYFGGEGYDEELGPALAKHPAFEGSTRAIKARTSHLHGFLVDVTPRTQTAKRRLETVGARQAKRA